jgi:hypothetical protein
MSDRNERQFTWFIVLLLVPHLLFRFNDLPGQLAWLFLIPMIFAVINFFGFIIKGMRYSIWELKYLLVVLLYLMISFKFDYSYYNILACALIVVMSIYALKFRDFKIEKLRYRMSLLVIVNFILIVIPDMFILKYINSVDKQSWGSRLEWNNFRGSEPDSIGEMDAFIYSGICWKYNKVYNYPKFISLAIMDESNSWVRPGYEHYEGNLLFHEQLHFDITEWTRREFHDSIYSLNSLDEEKTFDIYKHFRYLLSKRQTEYDSISKHGIDFIGQIKWNKKVRLKLK